MEKKRQEKRKMRRKGKLNRKKNEPHAFHQFVDYSPFPHQSEIFQDPMVRGVTVTLFHLYKTCSAEFAFNPSKNPRRRLTKGKAAEHNIILHVNDVVGYVKGHRYRVIDLLGTGTFSQVLKCQNIDTAEIVAVKIVKRKEAYFNQACVEIQVLQMLQEWEGEARNHILTMQDFFVFKGCLCIVFELLNMSLYELIKQNKFQGLSLNLVRIFVKQIVTALLVLEHNSVIHTDLKPENILLMSMRSPNIKLIDLGSSCFVGRPVYSYIQSRFYRSPEVILRIPYNSLIDMWSLACVAGELFLGLPLFPGLNEHDQLFRIVDMLGTIPEKVLDGGRATLKYYEWDPSNRKGSRYRLKSREEFAKENKLKPQQPRQYFRYQTLSDIIMNYQYRTTNKAEIEAEEVQRRMFLDFLVRLLQYEPHRRPHPSQLLEHPFLSGQFQGWEYFQFRPLSAVRRQYATRLRRRTHSVVAQGKEGPRSLRPPPPKLVYHPQILYKKISLYTQSNVVPYELYLPVHTAENRITIEPRKSTTEELQKRLKQGKSQGTRILSKDDTVKSLELVIEDDWAGSDHPDNQGGLRRSMSFSHKDGIPFDMLNVASNLGRHVQSGKDEQKDFGYLHTDVPPQISKQKLESAKIEQMNVREWIADSMRHATGGDMTVSGKSRIIQKVRSKKKTTSVDHLSLFWTRSSVSHSRSSLSSASSLSSSSRTMSPGTMSLPSFSPTLSSGSPTPNSPRNFLPLPPVVLPSANQQIQSEMDEYVELVRLQNEGKRIRRDELPRGRSQRGNRLVNFKRLMYQQSSNSEEDRDTGELVEPKNDQENGNGGSDNGKNNEND